jgi:hypothetical protein
VGGRGKRELSTNTYGRKSGVHQLTEMMARCVPENWEKSHPHKITGWVFMFYNAACCFDQKTKE